MGHQIIKQPNGLFCIYSSICDDIIAYNKKAEDIIEMEIEEQKCIIKHRVLETILKLESEKNPYYQFYLPYQEMLNRIESAHGKRRLKTVRKMIENKD